MAKWKKWEEEFLSSEYPKGDIEYMKQKLSRTETAIRAKASQMGIKQKIVKRSHEWSEEELDILRKNADCDDEWLSEKLGRSVRAIQHKVSKEGLRSDKWTEDELALIREHKYLTPAEFKERFESDRSENAISQKMREEYGTSLRIPRTVVDEDFSWFLGALYADGHVTDASVQFAVKDRDFAEELVRVIKESLRMNATFKERDGYYRVWSSCAKYAQVLRKDGNNPYSFIRCIKKNYPDVIEKYRWNFLGGVYDGDGSTRISKVGGSYGYVRPSFAVKGKKEQKFFSDILEDEGYKVGSSEFQLEIQGDQKKRKSILKKLDIRIKRKQSKSGTYQMNKKHAEQFIAKYHYLQTTPIGKYYGYFVNGEVVAVAVFGNTVSNAARDVVLGSEHSSKVRELKRFCLKEGHDVENAASKYLTDMVKRYANDVDVWAILTYADKDEGHYGTIYKAMSAIKIGETGEEVVFEYNGRKISSRSLVKYDLSKVSMRKSPGKVKYVIPAGTKDIRKKVREMVKDIE